MLSMLDLNTRHRLPFRLLLTKLLFIPILFSYPLYSDGWAEGALDQLSLKGKISQLMMIPVWTVGDVDNVDQALKLLDTYPIGGILFMQGTIERQIEAVSKLQQKSSLPLLVGQDNEWGLDLRLKGSLRFPRNITLGALQDNQLIYEFGKEVANQCIGVGVHVNFAPVVDVNNNPANPVISDRSFGEVPQKVSRKGLQYMQGMQEGAIMACAKHFPGHGDTSFDSHKTLPVLDKSVADLDAVEWVPFKALINKGLSSVMTAHLHFPQISSLPSSLCPSSISGLLKDQLKFDGLIFTDALNMKAICDRFEFGFSELQALIAGNDVLVYPSDVEKSIERIYVGVQRGEISEDEIDKKVLKILRAKEKFNLHLDRSVPKKELFSQSAIELKKRLFREAITLFQEGEQTPFTPNEKIAFVQIGRDVAMKDALELLDTPYEEQRPNFLPPLYTELSKDLNIDYFFIPKKSDGNFILETSDKLKGYSKVVVGVYEMNKRMKKNYGITESTLSLLKNLNQENLYLCLFGSPYSLKNFEDQRMILMAYENDEDAQIGCAEIFLNKRKAQGKLPITASAKFCEGSGH